MLVKQTACKCNRNFGMKWGDCFVSLLGIFRIRNDEMRKRLTVTILCILHYIEALIYDTAGYSSYFHCIGRIICKLFYG